MKISARGLGLAFGIFVALFLLSSTTCFAQGKKKKEKPVEKPAVAVTAETKPIATPAAPTIDTAFDNLKLRSIGPAIMGGRIDDFAVVESDPDTIYVGAASGGVWKTTNGGVTWEPLFDKEAVSTIGAVTVAPSDPSIVWVGTGEPNNRQSSSWGHGVYKSTDAGKTWNFLGLADTQHIGRIVIHPTNPDVVYVAALGHLWGPNADRGIYKTADGGKTWNKVLFINDDTGVVDVAMDPQSPDTIYAAAYERRRTPFGFNGGGPYGGIYKTTDGGSTWKKLAKGLPEDDTGRIGLSIYRKNPNIVYAVVENKKGGTFRSEDKGETWKKMSDTDPRPSYYSQIRVDPNNDLRIWVLAAPLSDSEDGGKTFTTQRGSSIHSDHHAMWIDPADSGHMIIGNDGGIDMTRDGGKTWDFVNTIPLGQFYEVSVDNQQPYTICGGLQDNAAWCGPSRTPFNEGITNSDWMRVVGGDGFYAMRDPADPNIVYAESQDGNLSRRDLRTNEARVISPRAKEGEPPHRFQWNTPLGISAHDPKTIYYGGDFLFKSTDRGETWTKLGGDLTTGVVRNSLPILGKTPSNDTLSRNDGVEWYPCITSLSESPLSAAVLWVGTDDGNLQVTRDGGQTWKNVAERVPGVPKGTYVSRVVASKYAEGTAYVTLDGHRGNDFKVYAYVTADYGETWKNIGDAIPGEAGSLHVIREHPSDQNMLFAGGEFGAYFSLDRGASWHRLKMNFPTVPVDDIQIQARENDLVLGTHGRSIWVLDDMAPLQQTDDKVLGSELHLYASRPGTAWRIYAAKWFNGNKAFLGPNPPDGALITYYLKTKPDEKEKVKVTIADKDGKKVREFDGEKEAGVNRANWDLRYDAPVPPTPEQLESQRQGFFFGGPRGPRALPGEYTVKVTVGKNEASGTVQVMEDPRIQAPAADRAAQQQALMKLYEMYKTSDEGRKTVVGLQASLKAAQESWKKTGAPKIPEEIHKSAEALGKKLEELHDKFARPDEAQGFAGAPLNWTPQPLPQRVGRLMFEIESYTAAPTAAEMDELGAITKLLSDAMDAVHKAVEGDVANLNKALNDAGVPRITAEEPPSSGHPPQPILP
jgi:photosystem II stability/assembly factor-like uncharacterized protein